MYAQTESTGAPPAPSSLHTLLQTYCTTKKYTITSSWLAPTHTYGVIIIEDAHCNVPIQTTIRAYISALIDDIRTGGIAPHPLVLQEGGVYGPIETSVLRQGKKPHELEAYLTTAFSNSEIGAAEYLHTTTPSFLFWGIEDKTLYEQNYAHFMTVAKDRENTTRFLAELQEKLEALRALIFSEELQAYYTTIASPAPQTLEMQSLVSLHTNALQYSISLDTYPTVRNLFATHDELTNINSEALQRELSQWQQATQSPVLLEDIPHLIEKKHLSLKEYPELYRYGKLHLYINTIPFLEFVKEKEALEQEILLRMAYTQEEKELINALRTFFIISKVLSLTLTPDEYTYYHNELTTHPRRFTDLIAYIQSYYQTYTPHLDITLIQQNANAFYDAVKNRDESLAQHTMQALRENNTSCAILILGGFHSKSIAEKLKQHGISFIIITPTVADAASNSMDTYYHVMERFWQGNTAP